MNTENDDPNADPKQETGIGRRDPLKGMAAAGATAMAASPTEAWQKRFAPCVHIEGA